MNFAACDIHRAMRSRLSQGIRRGRLAVLDIGSSKITCLILKIDQGKLEAGGSDQVSSTLLAAAEVVGDCTVQSRGVKRGEVIDMDAAARSVRRAVLGAERAAHPRIDRVDHVLVSFSGGRPESFSTVGETETETGQVTGRDISNALGNAPEPPIGPGRQVLHCQPVEISLDFQSGLTDPRGMTGRVLSIASHVVAVDARPLANLMECIRQCDLDLCGIVSAPYAAGLSALVEDEQRTGAICIDMGGSSTGLSVFLRDHLICAEQIRYGGQHVTGDIAGGLMMRHALAERIKCVHGGVVPTQADDREMIDAPRLGEEDAPEPRQISRGMLIGVIRPRIEETFRMVQSRLIELGIGAMPGCSVVLTGAACQLPGLDEVVTRLLGRRPRIGRPLRLAGLRSGLTGPEYAAAVGLAMYALSPHDELWDFEVPRPVHGRGRAGEMLRWLRTAW
ncbi:cell division protein FtsA [Paralimibaculum aggregatum]|uniref:Cell division protein FtsA n=1 Tax=Paralimibaculum aggregatum TaxID=3036245 RepID=A0ABQ6LGB1_9RHOB|nr:cell division protein FtsA [Limibaculum sp. NKW23]GMG82350.1 cell division protein FtsA [Limibaculum sp. NKW23]